jgi:hypothetical protein
MRKLALLLLCPALACAQTQVTIYNQRFAVVKERLQLDLKKGEQEVRITDITAHLEPDSVIVRDVKEPGALVVLEQNYEPDPLNQGLMLRKAEGQTILFETTHPQTGEKIRTPGTILRSGYVPHTTVFQQYGGGYATRQMAYAQPQGGGQPIVEVGGKILFGLPGTPLFDGLGDDAFLKPTLLWNLATQKPGTRELEFSYLTGGMRWEASYNLVAPEQGDRYDLVGWITLENMSGKDFTNTQVKLMAGDVNRAQEKEVVARLRFDGARRSDEAGAPIVTERTFDEYHLYDVVRELNVRDREIKQVEFLNAPSVPAKRIYIYDGAKIGQQHRGWNQETIRRQREYGTECNPKIWVMLEFENSEKAGLGIPLPRGKLKLYRRDRDGRNEFTGEDWIDHTPRDETVRLFSGNAFDIVGERKQTDYRLNNNGNELKESFEITLRNHKKEAVEVRVVETLYRWLQWEIETTSQDFAKKDARTIEYRVTLPPDGQAIINYTARYTW